MMMTSTYHPILLEDVIVIHVIENVELESTMLLANVITKLDVVIVFMDTLDPTVIIVKDLIPPTLFQLITVHKHVITPMITEILTVPTKDDITVTVPNTITNIDQLVKVTVMVIAQNHTTVSSTTINSTVTGNAVQEHTTQQDNVLAETNVYVGGDGLDRELNMFDVVNTRTE